MKRVLTGIQSSGKPHLGNILGAILPAIELSKNKKNECFFFIADLHSLTTIKDAKIRKDNIYSVAAAWLDLEIYGVFRDLPIHLLKLLSGFYRQ